MKKIILYLYLLVSLTSSGLAQTQYNIKNMTFNLPATAVKISISSLALNSRSQQRCAALPNIFKVNDIYLGFINLEIGQFPINFLENYKKVQDVLAEDLADIQQTTSEIVTINNNRVFIFSDKFRNEGGYYFVVLKSDNKQFFFGRLVYEDLSNYTTATTILYDFLNSVTFPYVNTPQTGTFTKNDCGAGNDTFGRDESYTVAAGTYTSTISQADADAKAQADVNANGQTNANAKGYCLFKSKAFTNVPFRKNNCITPKVGTIVNYSAALGAFTSYTSQADADAKAQAAGQANANLKGTCN